MADKVRFEILGLKEVYAAMRALPDKLKAQVLRNVHRRAGRITQRAMMLRAPQFRGAKTPGHSSFGTDLVNEIKISNSKVTPAGVLIGPSKKAHYARVLEYGTKKPRRTRGGGNRKIKQPANRGEVSPQPFLMPAIEASTPRVVRFISQEYGELVNKALERKVKRQAKKR